ncbi:MAG: hypothetical protein U0X40_04375 [Ferruginibacter sp.]
MVWLLFLPFLIALLQLKRYTRPLRYVFGYLLLSVLTQVISYILWRRKINNLPLLHIYTVLEYLVLLGFYYQLLKDFLPRILFPLLWILFPLFAVTDSLLIENIYGFNTYGRSAEALVFIFLAVSCFVKSASEGDRARLAFRGISQINFGFFLYFAGSLVLFSFRDFITHLAMPLRLNVWTLHSLLLVILYIFITTGQWKFSKK